MISQQCVKSSSFRSPQNRLCSLLLNKQLTLRRWNTTNLNNLFLTKRRVKVSSFELWLHTRCTRSREREATIRKTMETTRSRARRRGESRNKGWRQQRGDCKNKSGAYPRGNVSRSIVSTLTPLLFHFFSFAIVLLSRRLTGFVGPFFRRSTFLSHSRRIGFKLRPCEQYTNGTLESAYNKP